MARVTDDYIRKAYLARFGRMSRESQDAVIEALEVVRDCTNPAPVDGEQAPPSAPPPSLASSEGSGGDERC